MESWVTRGEVNNTIPTIHVVSDSVGTTAQTIVRAASACFEVYDPAVEIFARADSCEHLIAELDSHVSFHRAHGATPFLLFYTLVTPDLRNCLQDYVRKNEDIILAVDLLSPALDAIAKATGREPLREPGRLHSVNEYYFRRIEAMEFTIEHDDGRIPKDLPKADIVILGVSRTSKTPTSIYLGQQGYKVANVPLVAGLEIPRELFEVERSRLFGLMTTEEVLVGIRTRRLGKSFASSSQYADPAAVRRELEHARNIMRVLGCKVINTENRAIEETAQEIIRLYDIAHSRDIPHAPFE